MLENEEPWLPPKLQTSSTMPAISSQVPELTIINDGVLDARRKINHPLKSKSSENANSLNPSRTPFSPSVPDLSIINKSVDDNKGSSTKNRVLTQSYKNMLLTTHDQIIQQTRIQAVNDLSEEFVRETHPVRQGLLAKSQTSYDYKPNPLCKYVPSKITKPPSSPIHNLSSILIDSHAQGHNDGSLCEGIEDLQFKNVAGIISEIQKLVTPSKMQEDGSACNSNDQSEILRKLAKMYLTNEEYSSFAIDEELNN